MALEEDNSKNKNKKDVSILSGKWKGMATGCCTTSQQRSCTYCRMYGSEKARSNPFVIGTKNLKLEAIKDHESSKSHLHTLSCKVGKTAPPEQTAAVMALTSMKTACKLPRNRKENETLLRLRVDVRVSTNLL